MTALLFPAGLNIKFHNINMEEMEFYARSWNLQRIQMQKGLFSGSMIATHTPRMQLMRSSYSHGILMQGDFPKGTILIASVVTQSDITFQNKIAEKHEIKILRSGDEIDFLCNGESETFTLAIEEQFFYRMYHAYFGQDFQQHKKNKKTYVTPHLFSHFIQGIEEWITYLMQDHNKLQINKRYDEIETHILEHVFSCMYLDVHQKIRQKFPIKKARDLLHHSVNSSHNIIDLAQELGISERLLHHAFKNNYGFTPKQYLTNLRMHNVKQALSNSCSQTTTIASVIAKYHFFNHSTFTQAYKQMYGELPSETLMKES